MSTQIPHPAETQQNELAQWLFNFQRKIEPHTNKIILAIILGTIGLVAYQVLAKSAAAKTSAAWSEYAACTSADDFKTVADDHAGSPVEAWSRLEAARNYIQSGVLLSMTNRKASDESLENGKAQLEKLLNSPTTSDEVREQALSQMAVCLEALCDGDVKPVVEAYQKLLDKFPETHYGPWAKHRLEELQKPETGEFYAWFRKAKPAPPERPKPQDVKPGELPNVKLDGEADPLPPSTSGTTPVTPETKPAEGTTPATETKPAEGSKPAAEASAAEAKPAESPAAPEADDKPAEPAAEKPAAPPATEASKPAEAATEKGTEPAPEAPKP